MPDYPATTFISYARPDETFARRLYNDLTAAGIRPWLDRYDIPPGAIWDDEVQHGLAVCSHTVIVVSEAALSTRSVLSEADYADSRGKKLFAVAREALVNERLPRRLRAFRWFDAAGQDYDAALQGLLSVLPITAVPNPDAAPDPSGPRRDSPEYAPPDSADPVVAAAAWKRGNSAFHAGDLDAAMQAYTEAIRLAPQDAEPYVHRGTVLYTLRRYEDALGDFTLAQRLDPNLALLYNNRGVTYVALGQTAFALADFEEALMLNVEYALAWYNRAAVFMTMRRYRLATHSYTRAIAINDRVPLFFSSRGLSYAAQDLYEQALADYNQALALDEDYTGALAHRATLYARLGQTGQALADYDRVIALDSDQASAYTGRGEVYFCAGEYDLAVQDAAAAITRQPEQHRGYALRALANFRLNRIIDAAQDYAQAVKLDPAWESPDRAAMLLPVCPDAVRDAMRAFLAAQEP